MGTYLPAEGLETTLLHQNATFDFSLKLVVHIYDPKINAYKYPRFWVDAEVSLH